MTEVVSWCVSGSYFEVCNCEAVCPCRRHGDTKGGDSTFGICDFALSWQIKDGNADSVDLAGLAVVLAGSYSDDEPGQPWRVILYVDERGDQAQRDALTNIFLGRSGGATFQNFARAIGQVYAVRVARIELEHTANHESMQVGNYVSARTASPVRTDELVSCGIPGHDRPGQEVVAEHFRVGDASLRWEVQGRCGFATDFVYRSSA